jgi:uncharacterized protein
LRYEGSCTLWRPFMSRHLRLALLWSFMLLAMLGLKQIRIETDILGLVPASVAGVPELKRLNAQLADQRTLVLLLEAQDGQTLEEKHTEQLMQALRAVPGTQSVRDALSPPDMEQGFTPLVAYLTLNQPQAVFTQQLQQLSGSALDTNLDAAMSTLRTSLDAMAVTHAGYDPLGFMRHSIFRWQESMLAAAVDADGSAQVLLVEGAPAMGGYKEYAAWITQLKSVLAMQPALKGSFTGAPAFAAEIGSAMEQDMGGTAGICGLLVVLLFLVFQRSLRQLLALTACLVLNLAVALGLYGWFFGELGVVSAGFAAILMGLTVDYAMIVGREVQLTGSVKQGQAHSAAGIFWGSLTTAAPFAVLMTSVLPGGNQLGFLVMVGLLVGAAIMLWLYPGWAFGGKAARSPLVLPIPVLPRRAAWVCFGLLWLGAGVSIWQYRDRAKLSFDMKSMNPTNISAMTTLQRLQKLFPAWDDGVVYLVAEEGNPVQSSALEAGLEKLKAAGCVRDWLLPEGLLPMEADFRANVKALLQREAWLAEVQQKLSAKGFSEKASALPQALLNQASAWAQTAASTAFTEVQKHPLLTGVVLPPLGSAKAAAVGAVRLDQLPSMELHKKLRALDATGVRVAAWPLLQFDMEPLLARDAKMTLLPMIAVLALALLIALKKWRDAAVAVGLLLLALAWVFALVLWQSKLGPHFLHILGLVLLMGAGLDYMLHVIFALRREGGAVQPVMASTGMAVIFCALSTAIGFGSLYFASNHAMADLGMISGAGVLIVLVLALVMLPGLWQRRG